MKTSLLQTIVLSFLAHSAASALQYGDYTYMINTADTNTVTLTGYTGSGGTIEIPSVISNKAVTAVGYGAFAGNTTLTEVTIPYSILTIDEEAFSDCLGLRRVSIGNGVTNIARAAFYNCNDLTNVIFGSCVATIGESAFEMPSEGGPLFFTIPASVVYIGNRAFFDCYYLEGFYFRGNAPGWGSAVFGTTFWGEERALHFFHLPGTTGWGTGELSYYPNSLWNPSIQTGDDHFGVQTNGFGFMITGPINSLVKIETGTNLTHDVWNPIVTHKLIDGSVNFHDPGWTNYPNRFYRLSMP